MSKLSVLFPVYGKDRPDWVRLALDSILNQTYKDFILLVGVDGPVDTKLEELLKRYERKDLVEIIRFTENRGLASVLNDLINISNHKNCDYLARMDADDISLPDRFKKQVDFLNNHQEIDVLGGAIEEIDGNDDLRGKHVQYPLSHDNCRKFFRYRDPLAHPAVMFRASFFNKVSNGYRKEYRKNQDTMLWFDGFMNGCVFANLPDTVLLFRVNDDFYKRRNGWKRAKQMLCDRMKMNKALGYDISANCFAIAMFCMTISPSFIKKILYKIR